MGIQDRHIPVVSIVGFRRAAYVLVTFAVLVASSAEPCYPSRLAVVGFPEADQDSVFLDLPLGSYPIIRNRRTSDSVPYGDYLFMFATIADSHIRIGSGDDPRYIKANSISSDLLTCYVDDINAHTPPVDFVVHLGDLTDLADSVEFAVARSIFDSLEAPLYPVLGNHDNFKSDNKQRWKEFAGLDTTEYTFDYAGFHFIVIDCTLDPYVPPYVRCDSELRDWVAEDLFLHGSRPTFVLSHFNMWEREWDAKFDTTRSYAEYEGMPELRQTLEDAGNVLAVLNGHVHANRVEVHNGIYYVDIGATLVGPPSIRYFYVYPNKVHVTYAYISDDNLYSHVTALCERCISCFDPLLVCDYVDGEEADKQFKMYRDLASVTRPADESSSRFAFELRTDAQGRIETQISSDMVGSVEISLYDVLGRLFDRCVVEKNQPELVIDLTQGLPKLASIGNEIYFVRARLGNRALTRKLPLVRR